MRRAIRHKIRDGGRAVRAQIPGEVKHSPTARAGALQPRVAVRARLPFILNALLAAGTDRLVLDFLKQRFFFERALVGLGQSLARA